MRSTAGLIAATIAAVIAIQPLAAQGKGKGAEKNERNRGRAAAPALPGNRGQGNARAQSNQERRETRSDARIERRLEREFAGDVDLPKRARGRGAERNRFLRDVVVDDLRPSVRRFFVEDRPLSRAAVGAVARAHLRGVDEGELVIKPLDDHVRILNRDGTVLVALDDERIRNLGRWDVIPVDDDVADGSPAFCRSGAGHPVFGRHWCIDKRFGLGSDNDFRWGRTERITDLLFLQPVTRESLTRDAVLAVLGPVAFDRLALHAITLGLSDPLHGRWMVSPEPGASNVLLVTSGSVPVAEVVDIDRDNRADMLVVALRDW